ncbi:MAG: AEC family transporter [Burkholderiales bacterium]|nr:AEC family transporter [Burkholderiales bacterium]
MPVDPNRIADQVLLASPLFALVFLGYGLGRWGGWGKEASKALSAFVFTVAMPALLFRQMAGFGELSGVDARLLIAFFGGCLVVFVVGRLLSWRLFGHNGVEQSVFGLGGVFSNNVLLGIPIAHLLLSERHIPPVALALVFNALVLWTLVTASVEWARHGELSLHGIGRTLRGVITNPVVASIVGGAIYGFAGLEIPAAIDRPMAMLAEATGPMSLVALGLSLAEFGIRKGWKASSSIAAVKLLLHPLAVWGIARAIGLPLIETQAVVMMASLATGVNVYLMSRQFEALEGETSAALLISTALSAVTVPLWIAATVAL